MTIESQIVLKKVPSDTLCGFYYHFKIDENSLITAIFFPLVIEFQGFTDGNVVYAISHTDRFSPRLRRHFRAH